MSNVRLMKLLIATIITLLLATLQWLIIGGFVSHSYMWLLKADAPIIDAGYTMTALWSIVTILSFGYSCWAYDKLLKDKSKLRFAALLSAQLGLSGLLVFWGMVSVGLIVMVHR